MILIWFLFQMGGNVTSSKKEIIESMELKSFLPFQSPMFFIERENVSPRTHTFVRMHTRMHTHSHTFWTTSLPYVKDVYNIKALKYCCFSLPPSIHFKWNYNKSHHFTD